MATATGENEGVGVNSEVFDCPICLERLRKPKYLPCLHTFCESCLGTYIVSTTKDKKCPGSFQCPVCRQETKSPDENSHAEEWARLMPLNHMIFSLMENSKNFENKQEILCGPCEQDEETTPAKFWCNECQEGFCEGCKKSHKRFNISKSHNVISIEEARNLPRKIPDVDEPCPDHKGEVLKVYCVDHSKLCCVICLSINHRKCEDIKTFDEMAEEVKSSSDTPRLFERMIGVCNKVEKIRARKEEHLKQIEDQKKEMLERVSISVEKAIQRLTQCHEDFKNQCSQTHKQQQTKLIEHSDRLENIRKTLTNGEKMLKAVSEHGTPKQMFIASEKLRMQLEILEKEVEQCDDDQEVSYELILSENLSLITNMTTVAELSVKQKAAILASEKQRSAPKVDPLVEQLRSADINDIEAVQVWNVNGGGWYTGGTFLDNGNLLLANYSKQCLDVYDHLGNRLISHAVDYDPWDVALNNDYIMVTDYSGSLKRYSLIQSKFSCEKSIDTKLSKPKALNILKKNILVESNSNINILTLKGENLRTVQAHNNTYIASSESAFKDECFYFCRGRDLMCQTQDGKELFRHTLGNAEAPRGVALDCGNNIYVCGMNSQNIYVIAKDGKRSRVFMSSCDGIKKPYCMRFNMTGTEFLLTSYDTGSLSLYRLKLKN